MPNVVSNTPHLPALVASAALLMSAILVGPAQAGTGYAVGHESVTGAGTGYAGGAAAALDASTIHYNPAGMSVLDHDELIVGAQLIFPTVKFVNQGSTIFDGSPLNGTNDGKGGKFAPIPTIYWTRQVSDQVRFGLGVTAPWGLVTEYKDDWIGRYNELLTSLKIGNVNPAISYKINDQLSVGFGLNAQYATGKLRQAVDFGTACAAALGRPTCLGGFGLAPQLSDGYGTVKGDDVGFGYNIGILFHPNENFRLGAHYRSKVHFQFGGTVHFDVPAGARAFFTVAGIPTAFTDDSADFELTVPEQASVSAYVKADPRWAFMADLTWTRWSQFDELRIQFSNPATPTNVLQTKWKNVWRVGVGTVFDYSDEWTFRGGMAYDESPILDAYRGPGIPDSTRWVAAAGLSKQLSDTLTLDASYQHLFFKKGPARRPSPTGSSLNGYFDVNVDVIGLALRWRM